MIELFVTVIGLAMFEVISSLDNAVVNAQVLATMKSERVKKFFLTWGLLFGVFAVRGFLPSVIVFISDPSIGIMGAFQAMFSSDPRISESIEASSPFLMMGGGTFLFLLFLEWFFTEDRELGLPFEDPALKFGAVWYYAIAALYILVIAFTNIASGPMITAALVGYAAFFIAGGFKKNAEHQEEKMMNDTNSAMSDWSKVLFLEVIDMMFSMDGVVGAFAFTKMVPLILIGNGIGAFVVRELTIRNVDKIKKYAYLKHGAMYSIGVLGLIMLAEAFGNPMPMWLSPSVTFAFIGIFFWMSVQKLKKDAVASVNA